jgi:hypothetical protein
VTDSTTTLTVGYSICGSPDSMTALNLHEQLMEFNSVAMHH